MEAFPEDFSQKTFNELYMKHLETIGAKQRELTNAFRLDLYKKVKDAFQELKNEVQFEFPDTLDNELKMNILGEILARFPNVMYHTGAYIAPEWEKLTSCNRTDAKRYSIVLKKS